MTTDRSVRGALRRIVALTTVCGLVLACAAFVGADIVGGRRLLEADLTTLADVIASNSAAALMFADPDAALLTLSALKAKPSVVSACIYTRSGTVFSVYSPRAGSPALHPRRAPPAGARFNGRELEITRRIVFDGEVIGTLFIASDLRGMVAKIKSFSLLAVAILMASLVVALTVSTRLQRSLTEPILHLAGVADLVRRQKDYSLRATIEGRRSPGEIELLTAAFDDMIAEIQQRDDELEDTVAHRTSELRVSNAYLVEARDGAQRAADLNERLGRHTQAILNAAAEGLFELDQDGIATFINRSAARMLGYSAEELTGKRLHDIVHTDDCRSQPLQDCSVCSATLQPSLRAGSTLAFVTREGKRIPVEYSTSAMHGEGGAGVVVTFRDITERLAIERMKDEFVSTVSHELRTPLTSIRGALGLLGSGLLGVVSERATRMLGIAVSNTDRLVRLINDILDLEKGRSGRVELRREPTSVSELMASAVDVMQTVADRAGVRLTWSPDPSRLLVDSDRLVQTLTNLLGNAVKFSPADSAVHLSGGIEGDSFVFRVSDQGRGIPADKLEAIFERFQQVDASDSRDKGGTGLGLAICRNIVTAHGGRIWAESREGHGATFCFTIPLEIDRVALSLGPDRRPVVLVCEEDPAGPPPVLVVEDDADLARVIMASLENQGLRTVWAANGAQAIETCGTVIPALVVLDLLLPEVDGFGVVDWMKKNSALRSVPLLVYSALEVSAADRQKLQLGPTDFLTKSRTPMSVLTERAVTLLSSETRKELPGAA